jgi:phosphoribosylanthranilate isomerase
MVEPVRVKICGITTYEDARAALDAGADMLGFNFYPHSPRCIAPAAAAAIRARLAAEVRVVGVFVDATREQVTAAADTVGLSVLQFHGQETAAYCRGWTHPVIKAIRVRDADAAHEARSYAVDFILADAYVEGQPGGTGRRIATEMLEGFDSGRLILAGGLTPENVGAAVRAIHPFAVDVASGVETSPGRKDAQLMRRFVDNVHAA